MSAPIPASGSVGLLDGRPADPPASLTSLEHFRLADVLLRASQTRTAVVPFSHAYPEFTAADARSVREAALSRRLAQGERRIGAKVLPGGEFGWLTDGSLLRTGEVWADDFVDPHAEGKVATRLAETGALIAIPCVEIIDRRFGAPPAELSPADRITEGCFATKVFLGQPRPGGPLSARERITLTRLAEQIRALGHELWAGSLLLSDPVTDAVALTPGERVIELGPLGSLTLRVSAPAAPRSSSRQPDALSAGEDPHVI